MKATYDSKNKKFKVIWKDFYKEAKGEKSPYGRKMEAWKGSKPPTKLQIAQKIAELEDFAIQQEALSKAHASQLEISLSGKPDPNAPINAVLYLSNYDVKRISRSDKVQTLEGARRSVARFRNFLKDKHPHLCLHEIKKPIIEEWARYYNRYSYAVLKTDFIYLRVLFDKVIEEFEESPIKYVNQVRKFDLCDITQKPAGEKDAFTVEQLQGILDYFTAPPALKHKKFVRTTDNAMWMRKQRFFIFYFCMVTGWRVGDVMGMSWEQVNWESRTIYMKHAKTSASSQAETVLFITPLMERVLKEQKKLHDAYPYHKQYIFNCRRYLYEHTSKSFVRSEAQGMACIIKKLVKRMKWGRCADTEYGHNIASVSIHSMRKSVITELALLNGVESERIKYLVGHAQKSTMGRFYTKYKQYPERATRELVEYMEMLTNAEFYLNKLLYGAEAAKSSQSVVTMPNGWKSRLQQNFWTDDAIAEIERLLIAGQAPHLIQEWIQAANSLRLKLGEREVTVQLLGGGILKDLL